MIENISELPAEIQHKILMYCMIHPTASIMKELIKETEELNRYHFDIDNFKYTKLSFYNYLVNTGYLKDMYDFEYLLYLLY